MKFGLRTGLAILLVLAIGGDARPTPPQIDLPYNVKLQVVGDPTRVGPVELLLQFDVPHLPDGVHETMYVSVSVEGDIVYGGSESFEVDIGDTPAYSETLSVVLPRGNPEEASRSTLEVTLTKGAGGFSFPSWVTFYVLGDQLRYVNGRTSRGAEYYFPELRPALKPSRADLYWQRFGMKKKDVQHPEKLTAEKLHTTHRVILVFRKPQDREVAEELVGDIPEAADVKIKKGVPSFVVDISLEQWFELHERGIEVVSVCDAGAVAGQPED